MFNETWYVECIDITKELRHWYSFLLPYSPNLIKLSQVFTFLHIYIIRTLKILFLFSHQLTSLWNNPCFRHQRRQWIKKVKRKFLEKFTLKFKAEEQHLHLNTLQKRMELGLILFVLSTLRSTEYFKNMGGQNFEKLFHIIILLD